MRAECVVKGCVGPFQANMSDGVTDCIAPAFVGGRGGSVFANHRVLPWLPLHEQGDTNATAGAGDVAAAIWQRNAIVAIAKVVARFISLSNTAAAL